MEIFERDGKINFVDENDIFIGFDYEQDCSESFGYYFTNMNPSEIEFDNECRTVEGIKDYVFDPTFFKEIKGCDPEDNAAVFMMVNDKDVKYLVIYNSHNGYYSHGFAMSKREVILYDGDL